MQTGKSLTPGEVTAKRKDIHSHSQLELSVLSLQECYASFNVNNADNTPHCDHEISR